MERKFTFDDMKFVARSERVGDMFEVGIYDAWDECLLSAEYPAGAGAAAPAATAKPGARKRKGAGSAEDQAIDDLIAKFKHKVEEGEIDLA
jgi:hypothetical protein